MPQSQHVGLKVSGLYTAPNDYSGVPDGALDQADDVVIDYSNLVESRRGFALLTGTVSGVNNRVNRFATFQSFKIGQWGTSTLGYYASSAWTAYSGSYAAPDSVLAKVRTFEGNQNLYITTSTGVFKLDTYNGTPTSAGVAKGLDLQLALTGASATGFFGTNVVETITANTTNTSAVIGQCSDVTQLAVGQYVYGTGITSGTTIASIVASGVIVTGTGTITAGSNSMTSVSPTSGISSSVGQIISGTGIPTNTRVTTISSTTITMSNNATATGSASAFTVASDPVVTLSAAATASNTATSLVISSGAQVGYRCVFGIKDANGNLVYGAPSQFASITNNLGTTCNVTVTATLPSSITTTHFFQIYRTSQTATASISPIDEEQLVYEGNPNSTDISNGYVQITEITPDSLRGTALYTSQSQQGIAQSNFQPPVCKDACAFKTFGVYANVKLKQSINLTILGVGTSGSVVTSGDTLVIAGVTYTADTSETIGTGHFKVYTAGTPAQNISDTTNSLIRVINRYASNTTIYAYLLSGPADLPGQIFIEERGIGGATFNLTASAHGTAYKPNLPTSGTTVGSTVTSYKNGVMISKDGQFESVPLVNLLFAGSASKEILRAIPLREYVLILKQDGIFRMTGSSLSTFAIAPFDLTTKLIAPDSAQPLQNEVWGLFDQGVCSVSDTGTNVRSRPIETTLRSLIALCPNSIKTATFAVGYETDRKYILSLPVTDSDTVTSQQYVFNTFTNAWTRWTRSASTGYVDPTADNLLYLGNGLANTVSVERKTQTYTDFVDEGTSFTIVSSSGLVVTLNTTSGISVGDVLYQSVSVASVITAVSGSTVTVQSTLTWSNGAATVFAGIVNVIQWKPIVAGNPSFVRQYSEGVGIFKRTQFNSVKFTFFSDVSQNTEDTSPTGGGLTAWGQFAWGSVAWGGLLRPGKVRFLVPQEKQMASELVVKMTIRNGYSNWAMEGLSIAFNPVGEEVSSL